MNRLLPFFLIFIISCGGNSLRVNEEPTTTTTTTTINVIKKQMIENCEYKKVVGLSKVGELYNILDKAADQVVFIEDNGFNFEKGIKDARSLDLSIKDPKSDVEFLINDHLRSLASNKNNFVTGLNYYYQGYKLYLQDGNDFRAEEKYLKGDPYINEADKNIKSTENKIKAIDCLNQNFEINDKNETSTTSTTSTISNLYESVTWNWRIIGIDLVNNPGKGFIKIKDLGNGNCHFSYKGQDVSQTPVIFENLDSGAVEFSSTIGVGRLFYGPWIDPNIGYSGEQLLYDGEFGCRYTGTVTLSAEGYKFKTSYPEGVIDSPNYYLKIPNTDVELEYDIEILNTLRGFGAALIYNDYEDTPATTLTTTTTVAPTTTTTVAPTTTTTVAPTTTTSTTTTLPSACVNWYAKTEDNRRAMNTVMSDFFLDIIKYEYRSELELNQLINNIYNLMVRAEEIISSQSELKPNDSNVTADFDINAGFYDYFFGMGQYKKGYEENSQYYKTLGELTHISADSNLALYEINRNSC